MRLFVKSFIFLPCETSRTKKSLSATKITLHKEHKLLNPYFETTTLVYCYLTYVCINLI